MNISVVFILIYVITLSWCQDETVFHCSPKPGCQIAQCDSVAVGWDRPGFNIDKHLRDKEYPITCKSRNTAQSQNTVNLLSLVTRNVLDIGNIKSDLGELEKNFDDKIKNLDAFGMKESGGNFEKQSAEISSLQRKVEKQSEEIMVLKEDLVNVQKTNNNLVEELNELKETNDEMKEDLAKVQDVNIKLIEDNEKMKTAIALIEKNLVVMVKPQVQNRSKQITRPTPIIRTTLNPKTTTRTWKQTPKTQTTLKPTPSPENCKMKIRNICYFAVVNKRANVDYNKADEICKKRNADVGSIRSKKMYNVIVNYLRGNIPKGEPSVGIWTRMDFNPMTRSVTPAYPFVKWFPSYPFTGIEHKHRSNVFLVVNSVPNDHYQGMVNALPSWERHGVICQILI
uniref:uncharacterized protein LOC120345570 n=1 Tax=Styela clava TaxID=7725 RepID=UPI00193AC9DA|nr:uncharacterized protein LOC120345570 [Styela clava]